MRLAHAMVSRRRLAVIAHAACTLLVACSGRVTAESAPPADAGVEASSPSQPAKDAASRDVVYSGVCANGASSCAAAKACASNVVYWLDDGTMSPGVHVFAREEDAVAYVRSLGFQGALAGDYVEFSAGGDPYAFAPLDDNNAFVVVDGAVAPSVYAGVVRYAQCAEDAATE
jgi:hypothetical protein